MGNHKHVNSKEVSTCLENDTIVDNRCRGFSLLLALIYYSTSQIQNTAKLCPKMPPTLNGFKQP